MAHPSSTTIVAPLARARQPTGGGWSLRGRTLVKSRIGLRSWRDGSAHDCHIRVSSCRLGAPKPVEGGFYCKPQGTREDCFFDAHLQQTTGRRRGQGTSSKRCLLLVGPGQAEAVWKGGRGSQGFCGSLREDGCRRESSCVLCTGGIPKCRSRTRGASIPPTNSFGAGSRLSFVACRNPPAVSRISASRSRRAPGRWRSARLTSRCA
jgi:hypothetical protein